MAYRFLAALAGMMLLACSAFAQGGPPPLPGSPPPSAQSRDWYAAIGGQQQGPMTLDEIIARNLGDDTLVWREGMAEWTPAGRVAELRPATAQEEADRGEYYTDERGTAEGPFDREMMEMRIASGALRGETLIWYEGLGEWTALRETHLAPYLEGPERIRREAAEQAADPAVGLVGRWQGRIRQPVEGLPQPVEIDVTVSYDAGGALSGNGTGTLDLRAQGFAQPVQLQISMEGRWRAETLEGRRLRLSSQGTLRMAAPEIGVQESEAFDETEIVEIDGDTLRYDDGSTLRRAGG